MNSGKIFEKDIKDSVNKEKIYYLRLKDSPSSFGQDSSFARFTSKNPYDALCFYNGKLFPLELKHTKNSSFSFQKDKTEKSKMIKISQIEGLKQASAYENIYAGFIFNIYNEEKNANKCYWLNIKDFLNFYKTTTKCSINEKDIISFGGIEIKNEKKKIHYRYQIDELFSNIIKKGETLDGQKN